MEGSDDNSALSKKMDNLTESMNRLSQKFDDYIHEHENQSGQKAMARRSQADDEDNFTQDFTQDENKERGNWTGRMDFLLSCLGYAVGLGNVWRFPYLCYKNGGAVFFIPYVIMLFFVGIPIFFLELSLGQFTSSSPLTCWEMAPIFKGIGVGMVIVSGLVGIYYNMIIAWAIYYFFASFTSKLPWSKCHEDWAGDYCTDSDNEFHKKVFKNSTEGMIWCTQENNYTAMNNGACYEMVDEYKDKITGEMKDYIVQGVWNKELGLKQEPPIKAILAAEDYLNTEVLGSTFSDGLDDLGPMKWQLVLCLLCAWVIVCASLIKGVKSSGKVVYFTATFPYVVLVILLIRGVTLDGHFKGIEFYILKPDLDKLSEGSVWKDAAVQIFFSLSASWGGLIALSSYNRFHNDVMRDSLIVSIGNCLTSFFAGFVIFSFLGFLASELDVEVDEVAESGVTLAFVVYPDAVTRMPVSTLWALLFFLMLVTLGLDSEFALIETVTTSLMDQFPKMRKYKALVIIVTGIIFFLLGLTMTTEGGVYMLQVMDHYSGGWNVLILACFECVCIGWVYGFFRFREDIGIMIGKQSCFMPWAIISWWWGAMWCFVTIGGVVFICIYSWYDYTEVTLGSHEFVDWAPALGWLMTVAVLAGLFGTPIIMIIMKICKSESPLELFRPSRYWGPALPKHRKLMARYLSPDSFEIDPWEDERPAELSDVKAEFPDGNFNAAYKDDGTRF